VRVRVVVLASVLAVSSAARAGDDVTLHVRGSPRAVLEHLVPDGDFGGDRWATLCIAPCSAKAKSDDTFRIDGLDLDAYPSEPFTVNATAGDFDVDVTLGTPAGRRAGLLIAGIGIVTSVGGVITMVVGAMMNLSFCVLGPCEPEHRGDAVVYTGLGVGVAGLITMLVGFALAHTSTASHVDVKPTSPPPPPLAHPEPPEPLRPAFAPPPTVTTPLFVVHF